MNSPRVSICIPAYLQTECLQKTLTSVLMQNYSDFEIIITDDSPDDSVKNLLSDFNFPTIRYYKNKERLGSPENWNECIRKAHGSYIKILHHDDWFSYENSLEEFVKMLDENPEADFAFSAALVYNEKEKSTGVFQPDINQIKALKEDPPLLFFGNIIGPPSSTIFRKTNLSFDRSLIWLVDLDFYIRLLMQNRNFIRSEKTLITSTTEGVHQVTNYCKDNKQVELFEYTSLYKSIKDSISIQSAFKFNSFFRKLMCKYQVRSVKEIINCGYKDKIPFLIRMAIFQNRILKPMSYIKKIARKLNRLIKKTTERKGLSFSKESYSQCGEDLIVSHLLSGYLKIEKPSYLDIGAFHPFHYSNTALFYKSGSRGVCVEPDPLLFREIKKHRKEDICINAGVASSSANAADFYIMSSKTLNTFSKEEAERYESFDNQKIEQVISIPLLSVNETIEKYFSKCPDFVSIDVEGLDLEIVKSFDFQKYRPIVFCIETLTYSEDRSERKISEIIRFMEEQNYLLYGDTHINSIFVERQKWDER